MSERDRLFKLVDNLAMATIVVRDANPGMVDNALDVIRESKSYKALLAALSSEPADHCKDCCCAQAWEALGITEYTSKSIPEHIRELRAGESPEPKE